MADTQQPIIVKKIKKGGHGHHGGAWKVAYADFVTAMMAFFLLLWLLNAVTQDQLEGISNYFAPTAISRSTSGSGGIMGGRTALDEGALENITARPAVVMDLPPPRAGAGGGTDDNAPDVEAAGPEDVVPQTSDQDETKKLREKQEEEEFRAAEGELQKAMEKIPELGRLVESLLVDNTPEGLRIQIVDQEGLAMFPRGSAEMYGHTRKILELVAKVIQSMPQQIAISGHTDATRYVSSRGYSNWELSADRANASRRAMLELGVPFERVARVVGMAATEPLLSDDPTNARNRRLSIVLLRGTGKREPEPGDAGETGAEGADMKPAAYSNGSVSANGAESENVRPSDSAAEAGKSIDDKAWKQPSEIKPGSGDGEEFLPGLKEIRRRQFRELSK